MKGSGGFKLAILAAIEFFTSTRVYLSGSASTMIPGSSFSAGKRTSGYWGWKRCERSPMPLGRIRSSNG
jgi:hypothetical protein